MKKLFRGIFTLLLCFSFVGICSACTEKKEEQKDPVTPTPEQPKPKKRLQYILVDSNNAKRQYYLNEDFDASNLKVIAQYSDGDKKDVSSEIVVDSDAYDKTSLGSYSIRVSYTFDGIMKSAYYDVSVKSIMENIEEKYIVGLEASVEKTEYKINEELEYDDLAVSLVYSDGTTESITEGYTVIDDFIPENKPGNYPLVISYSKEYTLNQFSENVTVKNFIMFTIKDNLVSINFKSGTTNLEYGSRFSHDDWVVEAVYESGDKKDIPNSEFTNVTSVDTFKSGEQKCRISYSEMDIIQRTEVTVVVGENPYAGVELSKSITATQLKVTSEEVNNRKQALLASEIDSFFTPAEGVLKYLNSNGSTINSIELPCKKGITFTVECFVKLTVSASSNGSSNISLMRVVDENGEVQKQITTLPETSRYEVALKGTGGASIIYSLVPGTYTIEFVSGLNDAAIYANETGNNKDIPSSRAGRVYSIKVES